MRYRRARAAGATWFFTVNLADRRSDLLVRHVDLLRSAFRSVHARHPFEIVAVVVMPEHLHALWRLPPDDGEFSMRWGLIKSSFSRLLGRHDEHVSTSRARKRERGLWQRRFWEHQIRGDDDLARHVDYIHFNPVKHGYVRTAAEWPHSSLHRYIRCGWVGESWGGGQGAGVGCYGERAVPTA